MNIAQSTGVRLAGSTGLAVILVLGVPTAASAQTPAELLDRLEKLEGEVAAQRDRIVEQDAVIAAQKAQIESINHQLVGPTTLGAMRGTGMQSGTATAPVFGDPAMPDAPVGEDPGLPQVEAKVEAVPEGQGVLTPSGVLVVEPAFEYINSANNRLVFRGIELVPGIQIGLIEATDADRDTLSGSLAVRYGLFDGFEVEARVPYLYRSDRIEVAQQRDEGIVRQIKLKESNIGDAEFAVRYQFNRPRRQNPIFVGTLRVKTPSGKGPFEVGYDEFGVATGLATGSGFWAVQPGVNFLLPSDPAVIFGGLAYLYHIPENVNRIVAETPIGRVDPGDAISANLGFGFALNPRFSFSLAYRHSYIFPTKTEIGDVEEKSKHLQVGSLNFGMSYRLTEKQTINFGFEFGVTEDAPDLSVTIRLPLRFGLGR